MHCAHKIHTHVHVCKGEEPSVSQAAILEERSKNMIKVKKKACLVKDVKTSRNKLLQAVLCKSEYANM